MPQIGRFVAEDPNKGNVFIPQSLNPYLHCYNNPMKWVDRDGCQAYSVTDGVHGGYTLFVVPNVFDGIQIWAGAVPFFTLLNDLGQYLIGGFRRVETDWWGAAGTMADLAELSRTGSISLKPGISTAISAVELINWGFSSKYQAREAIFNQFDRSVWRSPDRDTVDAKFNAAMLHMAYYMERGKVVIRRAGDVFDSSVFWNCHILGMVTWQYDPLLAPEWSRLGGYNGGYINPRRHFQHDRYYFFAACETAHGLISQMNDFIRNVHIPTSSTLTAEELAKKMFEAAAIGAVSTLQDDTTYSDAEKTNTTQSSTETVNRATEHQGSSSGHITKY